LKWVKQLFHRRPSPLFDLVILWDWEYDDDFVLAMLTGAHRRRLSARAFRPFEFTVFNDLCRQAEFSPTLLLDRASDVHPSLLPVLSDLSHKGCRLINDPQHMIWCRDKATMHLELVEQGIPVPYGIILSRQDHPESALHLALEKLGSPFVIKPAEGGGGEGVILEAASPDHIRQALAESKTGKVVLQNRVQPATIGTHRAWFRVFYLLGEIIPCWWDDRTHLYDIITDLPQHQLTAMQHIVQHIARISRMDFFTTEIALTDKAELLVIDFVNEMCDMRLQSRHADGVPDQLVLRMVDMLLAHLDR
jgi:hypothetical protein